MKNKKKRHGVSLTLQLVLITVIPLLLLGSVLAVTSRFALERGMKQQTLRGLEGLDSSVFTALHEFDYKDLTKNEKGIVKKGYYQLTGNYELMDHVKENSGIDIAVFFGEDLERMAIDTEAASSEIGRSFGDIEAGALSQAEDVQKATEHIESMGNVVSGIVTNMHKLHKCADEMKRESGDSDRIIQELSDVNGKTEDAISKVDEQIQKTDASVHQIRNAVQLITAIADETTLLAMNANIEAARAGESGKGFAVVAGEIQKLARQSNDSAEEIEDVLEQLLKNSEMRVEIMSSVKESVDKQKKKLQETKQKLGIVNGGIEDSQHEVLLVMQETEQCEKYQQKAVGIIQGLLAVAEQNAVNVEQETEAMHGLDKTMEVLTLEAENIRSLAEHMKKELDYFQTE